MKRMALGAWKVALAVVATGCAPRHDVREHPQEIYRAQQPGPPGPPYTPTRSPLTGHKLAGPKAVAVANPNDRPIALFGRVVQFQDRTIATTSPHWVAEGGLEYVVEWRSDVPVVAVATYAHGQAVCFGTEDGRVGCIRPTNHHGIQVEWVLKERVRSMAVFRSGVAWHLCVVRADGSTTCNTTGQSWPVEDASGVTFRASAPTDDQNRQSAALADAFSKIGKLKKILSEPSLAIDEQNRLFRLEQTGATLVLEGVADATPECARMLDGTVRCWGANQFGQVGTGRRSASEATPVPVVGLQGITQVATSGVNACAIRKDGALFCWGAQFGRDFARESRKVPLCQLQDPPPATPEAPCPSVSRGGDDLCGRTRYNAQRFGGNQPPIVLRDNDGQCAGPGEDYVPAPVRVSVVDQAVFVEPSHEGLRIVRSDGVIVEESGTFSREIVVRALAR